MHIHSEDGGHDLAHHDHAGHSHALGHDHSQGMSASLLAWALAATVALVALEFLGGWLGSSVALVSDGVHNLTDIPPMVLAWLAQRWALRQPTPEKTYGWHRTGILAAFVNALLLGLAAVWILVEAVQRFLEPEPVVTGWMMGVSLFALVVNGSITLALVRGRSDLNVRAIFVHNLGDALSNVAILAGALIIGRTGWLWVDAALSAGIGALVLYSSFGILRESAHILLEGSPRSVRIEDVARSILSVPGVQEVHDIHIWTLGTNLHALSCHARIPDMHMDASERILQNIRAALEREFHITHSTVQLERAGLPSSSSPIMPQPANVAPPE